MRYALLALALVGCATAPKGPTPEQARANALDDQCFATLQNTAAPQAERDNCWAWLQQRQARMTAEKTAGLQAQAAQNAQWAGAAAAVSAQSQPVPEAPPAQQPSYVPPMPTSTTCQNIGGGVTNCTTY